MTGGGRDAGCLPRSAPTILRVPRGDVPAVFCAGGPAAGPLGGLAPLEVDEAGRKLLGSWRDAGDCAGEDPSGLPSRLRDLSSMATPAQGEAPSPVVATAGKLRGSGVAGATPDVPGLPKRPRGLAKLLLSPGLPGFRPGLRPGLEPGPRPPYLLPVRALPYVSGLGP